MICDRYIYSTIAYHKALGVDLSRIDFKRLPVLLPDFSFYLWAEKKVYLQRLLNRKTHSVSDRNLEKNRVLQQKIHQEFLTLPVISINTSYLTPKEVCAKILRTIDF